MKNDNSSPSTKAFYSDLPPFAKFDDLIHDKFFFPAPNEWHVVVADVENSTLAIEQGRYKDVNTVGAAAIVCVENVLKGVSFPFVFGGDGATLLIPNEHLNETRTALGALKAFAKKNFGLSLRAGSVRVSELRSRKTEIIVGKYELGRGKQIAILRGGGCALAESLVKSCDSYQIEEHDSPPQLEGLSCRWQPVPSKNGAILSLLVKTVVPSDWNTYQEVLNFLGGLFQKPLGSENPVNERMQFRKLRGLLKDELRLHGVKPYLFVGLVNTLFGYLLFRTRLHNWFSLTRVYRGATRNHSDYRKFDDMLRMVVDCTEFQKKRIVQFLEQLREENRIYYGIHVSSEALLTCHSRGLSDGEHIHFVDGIDGGYALAAKQLKAQEELQAPLAARSN